MIRPKTLLRAPLQLCLALGLALASLCPVDAIAAQVDTTFYRDLAAYHAPIVIQLLGRYPRGDLFTRFDFDGDWNGDNNWRNVKRFDPKPAVYFEVIESETHYFITYNFFYPRDYWDICFWWVCHENDLEGIRVTVQKDSSSSWGKVWMVETQHHGALSVDHNPQLQWVESMNDPFPAHEHVVVTSEKGKHGIHPWDGAPINEPHLTFAYGTDLSSLRAYELVSLHELWDHRDEVGRGKTFASTFHHQGARFSMGDLPAAFTGRVWSNAAANPPWAWQIQDGIPQGDWFLDPASAICARGDCPESGFSMNYLHHFYFGI